MFFRSNILKLSLFATGLSGIVAEYILATLATYFIGDSVVQWTMVLSVMLFAMGLGSRFSKWLDDKYLLERFVMIEFLLSILVSISALATYVMASKYYISAFLIYGFCILIGFMIGMEIPLVMRLNNQFEELKVNVSAVMEQDYYGSLLGGLFFVFVGLPYLGLTYTPFVLGAVNFLVAILLITFLWKGFSAWHRRFLPIMGVFVVAIMVMGVWWAEPLVLFGEQLCYKDKIVYQMQSRYQRLVITEWRGNHWFYINGNQQLSTLDEWMYHEPLVHPAMQLVPDARNVLVLGGGDGCAVREILKYPNVEKVTLVDLDAEVTALAQTHPIFLDMNKGALNDPRVTVINTDAYQYLEQEEAFYDVIISDFPDPKSIELSRLFSYEFYRMCYLHLRPHGAIIVQSGSPYYATKAFVCIDKTVTEAGFSTIPLHNQVITLGQWGWVLGSKSLPKDTLKPILQSFHYNNIETQWLTNEAMQHITSFGKPLVPVDTAAIEVNRVHHPVLYKYYRQGNWDWY